MFDTATSKPALSSSLARLIVFSGLATAGAVAGCSRGLDYESFDIKGTITVDGQPVENGYVMFRPAGPGKGTGGKAEIANCSYHLKEVPAGPVCFSFLARRQTGRMVNSGYSEEKIAETVDLIPDEYRNGLTREIVDGSQQDFEL